MCYNTVRDIPALNCLKIINKTMKNISIDINDLISKHSSGMTQANLSKEFGIGEKSIVKILKNNGIDTSRKLVSVDINEAIKLLDSGRGVSGVAEALGVTRMVMIRIFKNAGIKTRNRSEQQFARMASYTPEQRKLLATPSHIAARGCKRRTSSKELIAQTRERTQSILKSDDEAILAKMLKQRGIKTTPQKAIGIYNCDLATDSVAVEVWGGHWHWHGAHLARTEKRFNEIMNRGFHILVVAVNVTSPLTDAVADYVASYIQEASRNPSAAREYRVIWSACEFFTCGGINDNNFSVKPPFTATRNVISGRYETIPR